MRGILAQLVLGTAGLDAWDECSPVWSQDDLLKGEKGSNEGHVSAVSCSLVGDWVD